MDYKEPEYINDLAIKLKNELKELSNERKELETKLKRREDKFNQYRTQNAAESVGYRTGITSKNDKDIESLELDVDNMNLEMAILIPELRACLHNLEKDTRHWEALTSNSKQKLLEQFLGKSSIKSNSKDQTGPTYSTAYSILEVEKIDEIYDDYISRIGQLRANRGSMINEARLENHKLTAQIAQSRNETTENITKNISLEKAINELKDLLFFEKSKEKILKEEHIRSRKELETKFDKENGWHYEVFKGKTSDNLFPLDLFINTLRPWIFAADNSWENPKTFESLLLSAVETEINNGWLPPNSSKKDLKSIAIDFVSSSTAIPFNVFYTLINIVIEKYE